MTKREAAIVMSYTGITLGSFSDFHEYAEKVMGRPVWTHEFASREVCDQLKEAAKEDFINISVS